MKWDIDNFAERATKAIGSSTSLAIHTIIFLVCISLIIANIHAQAIMLGLTTIVSLEAIYLSLFIQITVNKNSQTITEISQDVDEIQNDIDEIQEDIEDISEDVDEIQRDVDEIQEDVEDISEEVVEQPNGTISESESLAISDSERLQKVEELLQTLVKEMGRNSPRE